MSEFLKVQKYNADGTPRAGKWATGCPEWETIGSVVTVGSFTYTVKRAIMANGTLQCVVNMAVKGTRQSILLTAAQCAELPGTEVVVTVCREDDISTAGLVWTATGLVQRPVSPASLPTGTVIDSGMTVVGPTTAELPSGPDPAVCAALATAPAALSAYMATFGIVVPA